MEYHLVMSSALDAHPLWHRNQLESRKSPIKVINRLGDEQERERDNKTKGERQTQRETDIERETD